MLVILAAWFTEEGWVVVLAGLNLILVVRVLFWMRGMRQTVRRIEILFHGVQDRLLFAVNTASDARETARRATGKFTEEDFKGSVEPTRIRKR